MKNPFTHNISAAFLLSIGLIGCVPEKNLELPKHVLAVYPSASQPPVSSPSWGVIEQTIPWLGKIRAVDEYRPDHILDAAEIERQIAHYRKIAPEMPGVAFYGNTNPALAREADSFCKKYFVEPAPDVKVDSPASGKNGRKIIRYKGFVDNRLVYDGPDPSFRWDFSEDVPGEHIITMHAMDDSWNRAASQISVTPTKGEIQN